MYGGSLGPLGTEGMLEFSKPRNGDAKDTNPKDACGIKKVPYSTLPAPVLAECAVGMLEGALEYGRHNYRVIGVRSSVYYDAALRHLTAWWEGEDTDEKSGLSHITKCITSCMVLRDAMIRGKMVDDRPPGTAEFIQELNKQVAGLLEKHPHPKEAFLAYGDMPTRYQP